MAFSKKGKSFWYAAAGSLILILYGIVTTFQPSSFARVYATYGGFFIVLSLAWGYAFDKFQPDKFDIIGSLIVLLGVFIIYYAPRG